jgi:hypothetical protein
MRGVLFVVVLGACGARTELAGTHAVMHDAGPGGCHDEIVATDPAGATALALDGDVVFWGTNDGLVRVRDAAGVTTTLASAGDVITSVAVDSNYVYYATTGHVRSVPRGGGSPSDLGAGVGQPFALALSQSPQLGGEAVYYLDYGAGFAAGSVGSLRNGQSAEVIHGLDAPSGLAVDDDYVYVASAFADVDGLSYQGPLFRIDKHSLVRSLVVQDLLEPSSVVLYDGRIYYVEQTDASSTLHGGVRSVSIAGGPTQVELAVDGVLPLDLAVDTSGVYATVYSQDQGALVQASSGGAPMTLASTPHAYYGAVRTSATAIYWTIQWQGAAPPDGASVRKICK